MITTAVRKIRSRDLQLGGGDVGTRGDEMMEWDDGVISAGLRRMLGWERGEGREGRGGRGGRGG